MTLLSWPLRWLVFFGWMAGQIVRSTGQVLADIVVRRDRSEPRIVAFDSAARSAFEATLLSVLISLTPGSLVVAMRRSDRYTLFVHSLYAGAQTLTELSRIERRLLHAVRPGGERS